MNKVGRTLVTCRQHSKVFSHHLSNIRMNPKTMKKNELSQALRQAGKIPYHKAKAVELRADLEKHLKFLQKSFPDQHTLYGVQDIALICCTGITADILVGIASDSLYKIEFSANGVCLAGDRTKLQALPDSIKNVKRANAITSNDEKTDVHTIMSGKDVNSYSIQREMSVIRQGLL